MQIPEFPLDPNISLEDKLLGSDAENNFKTKNFQLGTIFNLFQQTLEATSGGTTRLADGTFTQITGTGTIADPYRINVTGIGDQVMLAEGNNVTITGTGTNADPFVINSDDPPESTKLQQGTNITITGDGTTASPFVINNDGTPVLADENTILGRLSTGTGEPESLTPLQVRQLLEIETTQQLNARDAANRDRANHTGTDGGLTETSGSSTGTISNLSPAKNFSMAYTKIGRLVTVHIYYQFDPSSSTGNLEITGLPFTPAFSGAIAPVVLTIGDQNPDDKICNIGILSGTSVQLYATSSVSVTPQPLSGVSFTAADILRSTFSYIATI